MCTAHHLHSCLFLLIVLAVVTLWTLGKSYLYIISIICACCLACRSNCTCIDTTCCYMTWEHQTSLYCDMSIRDVPYHASCVIVQVLTWTTFEPLFLILLHTHTFQTLDWKLQILAVSSAQVYHRIAHALNIGHKLFLVHHEEQALLYLSISLNC